MNSRLVYRNWLSAISFVLCLISFVPPALGAESAEDREARLGWWREARFGMFIHWGPVSLKGTEIGWSRGAEVPAEEYDQLYRGFNPTNFDARAWVKLAKATGMRYIVLTTKHHDGFCLWDTKCTDYSIMRTPFHRDVVKELAAACKKEGVVFCAYHSILDWQHPDYPLGSPGGKTEKPNPNMDRYYAYLKNQLTELIAGYGPLGILWFDGEWEAPWTTQRAHALDRYLRELQPSLIINNRIDKGRRDMEGTTAVGDFAGDYDTPEQRTGTFQTDRPWESCITICQQWAWKPDDALKPLKECIQTLAVCAGGDGNLLLNVGPMPTGEIEPRQAARLKEVGAWMLKNGRSIYGTRGGPFKPGKWGASTYRADTIYLHVFQWPADGLKLPAIGARVRKARVLGGGAVKVTQTDAGLWLPVPADGRDENDTVVELRLASPASEVRPVDVRTE